MNDDGAQLYSALVKKQFQEKQEFYQRLERVGGIG